MPVLDRLLITGAAGSLGQVARARLGGFARVLRLSDCAPLKPEAAHEEVMVGDLGDAGFVDRVVQECDGILHLGGISVEDRFEPIAQANILGLHNLYAAAQRHGQPRILFASSNHAIGFYRTSERIDASAVPRPDGLYGVSKVFGEALATMYFHKTGQETALVRIGSCFEEPRDHRMLETWLSFDDFISLIERVFTAETLGCPIIYGVSDNDGVWWDNSAAAELGWRPKDTSEQFRAKIDANCTKPAPDDPAAQFQGGQFAAAPILPDND